MNDRRPMSERVETLPAGRRAIWFAIRLAVLPVYAIRHPMKIVRYVATIASLRRRGIKGASRRQWVRWHLIIKAHLGDDAQAEALTRYCSFIGGVSGLPWPGIVALMRYAAELTEPGRGESLAGVKNRIDVYARQMVRARVRAAARAAMEQQS